MTDFPYQLVLTTCPDDETATHIAEALVSQQLAACVNILPDIRSVYRWKGQIEHDQEVLLIIKTRERDYPQLEAAIRQRHPYELPEIIAVPIKTGLTEYLHWIDASLEK